MQDTIKKIVIPVAAIAALGYGGAQLAGASGGTTPAPVTTTAPDGGAADATEAPGTETKDDASGPNEAPGTETNDGPDGGDAAEAVTGADATKAKEAALAAVPGTVTKLSRETQDDPSAAADKPEAGDTPDPSYEAQIAYDVEVTKADGSQVDVHLDQAFKVLGQEADRPDGNDAQDNGADGETAD